MLTTLQESPLYTTLLLLSYVVLTFLHTFREYIFGAINSRLSHLTPFYCPFWSFFLDISKIYNEAWFSISDFDSSLRKEGQISVFSSTVTSPSQCSPTFSNISQQRSFPLSSWYSGFFLWIVTEICFFTRLAYLLHSSAFIERQPKEKVLLCSS